MADTPNVEETPGGTEASWWPLIRRRGSQIGYGWINPPHRELTGEELTKAANLEIAWETILGLAPANTPIDRLAQFWVDTNLPKDDIAEIRNLATGVFENEEVAEEWLKQPNLATDNRPPISLLGTPEGFKRVKTLLQRIDYGVLA